MLKLLHQAGVKTSMETEEAGRARIPLERPAKPTSGDIHKYSANAIESVHIRRGSDCPIKIEISMKSEVGFFQVEEVLIPKIMSGPAISRLLSALPCT